MVNTLMLGACGILDLFWWSILGDMLALYENPVKIMGFGLSANVFGILIGGSLGSTLMASGDPGYNPTLIGLSVVCISFLLLPPLHPQLIALLQHLTYLNSVYVKEHSEPTVVDSSFYAQFTEREKEIIQLLITGKTYRSIAEELFVSENTVKTHVKNIYSKAGIQSKYELMHIFIQSPHEKNNL